MTTTIHGFSLSGEFTHSGTAGSEVMLEGAEFDPGADCTITLGDLEVTVEALAETGITLTVPDSAPRGLFKASDVQSNLRSEFLFLLTQVITVRFADNIPFSVSKYDVGKIEDLSANHFVVVKIPRPSTKATPIIARVVFEL